MIYEIRPRACDIYLAGSESVIDGSTWVEVDVYDHLAHSRGWVNRSYIEERPNPCFTNADLCGL